MEVLSKVMSFIMVVVLLFLLPIDYLLEHQGVISGGHVENELTRFVEVVREEGCLEVEMYENFINRLSLTGMNFDIEIEHAVPKEGSKISAVEDLPGVLLASAEIHSLPYGGIDSDEIIPFATHTHTDACYAGHRHDASCDSITIAFNRSNSTSGTKTHKNVNVMCGYCGKRFLSISIDSETYETGYIASTITITTDTSTYTYSETNIGYSYAYNDYITLGDEI